MLFRFWLVIFYDEAEPIKLIVRAYPTTILMGVSAAIHAKDPGAGQLNAVERNRGNLKANPG